MKYLIISLFIFFASLSFSNECIVVFEYQIFHYNYTIYEYTEFDEFYKKDIRYKGFKVNGLYFLMKENEFVDYNYQLIEKCTGIMLHKTDDSIDRMFYDVYFEFDYEYNLIRIEFYNDILILFL